jgi:hypothetical protein
MSYENPWLYNDEVVDDNIPENAVGFVYCITNITNGKKYLGKKTLFFSKTRKIKGKKKKEKIVSDWKEYFGSNHELIGDVETFGKNNFKRQVLRFCKSKGEASYYEAKFIFDVDAILSENYYNSWISVKVSKSHIKLDPSHSIVV